MTALFAATLDRSVRACARSGVAATKADLFRGWAQRRDVSQSHHRRWRWWLLPFLPLDSGEERAR